MKLLWGYSEFHNLLSERPSIASGIVVDTNVLISATYDLDLFFENTTSLLVELIERGIPLFCNVNVRSEFLEIHRRIIFTEALLSFEAATKRSSLPTDLAKKLSSLRSNQSTRERTDRRPLRLSEADLKAFKMLMISENTDSGNLWETFSKDYVNDKLFSVWDEAVENFGLNFLSLREGDNSSFILNPPDWNVTMDLMSREGISSSDAMILNMFLSSRFEAILSSDADLGISILRRKTENKICIIPDELMESLKDFP